jgi:phosphoribosylamine--glycine ligase
LASQGYPGTYEKEKVITGINQAEQQPAVVFQAGTKMQLGQLVTDGGRVLGVTATGETFTDAIAQVYQAVEKIDFEGKYYRRDIGHRALKH